MKFKFVNWPITKLINLYEHKKIDLNPPYQRNDIWTNISKRRLIDSIKVNYPLPLFFLYEKEEDNYEMVDGQQRTRAIYGYIKGYFKDLNNKPFDDKAKDIFDKYEISVCIIYDVTNYSLLSDFYYRVNKFGTKLNRPEILKAQYAETNIQELINSISDLDDFKNLNLFSERTLERMVDLDLIGEIIGLMEYGISEKKKAADELYKTDISKDKAEAIYLSFIEILNLFQKLNSIYPINKTRYKQRNDFYTLWNFIYENQNLSEDELSYFYKILVLIGEDIYPTNDECLPFMNYAYHCVTQSNSARAREQRLNFLKELFLNENEDPNETQIQILNYYKLELTDITKVGCHTTLFGPKIQEVKGFPLLF